MASPVLPRSRSGTGPARVGIDVRITNAELVRRMHLDPTSAAPVLYRRYEPRVRWLVRSVLGADEDCHDLVQQIFKDLLERGLRLREPDKLPSWIRSVTLCAVYEEYRRRRARKNVELSLPDRGVVDFERDIESRDLLIRAVAMVQKLPPEERAVFTMRIVEERSCLEVAELTGWSPATVKRRLARANQRFQAMLSRNVELTRKARGGARTDVRPAPAPHDAGA
jgi:RNA polymerase sigma-70 factor (ECF subfamily)